MGVSLKPSDAVEGGAVPVDMNLLYKEARFNVFDYTTKEGKVVGTTVALRVKSVNDDGSEYEQQYSVGDPGRFTVSEDGKSIEGPNMSKSSNAFLFLKGLVDAGFPENKLGDDISVLDGTYAYHIGVPEPKRSGLAPRPVAEGQVVRPKTLSIPSKILRLPWEKKTGAKGAATKPAAKGKVADENVGDGENDMGDNDGVVAKAVAFVAAHATEGKAIRKSLGVAVFKELAKDPDKDAIAEMIYAKDAPEFEAGLAAEGITLADK